MGSGFVAPAHGPKRQVDFVIITTGCGFQATSFLGHGKEGVVLLDGPGKYVQLGRSLDSAERVMVAGEGGRGMQIAEMLAGGGSKVTLLLSFWQRDVPSPLSLSVLTDAAREKGIDVSHGRVNRAFGSGRLEGVLAEGRVTPCDVLAVVPRRTPRPIPMVGRLGRHGGVQVDRWMKTCVRGVLAAGGCAELEGGFPPCGTLEDVPVTSGRIAGANSTGQNLCASFAHHVQVQAFGLGWSKAGAGLAACRAVGLDVNAIGRRWNRYSACTIVYERRRGKVVGIETVEGSKTFSPEVPLAVSQSASLRSLAYGVVSCSSDISLVSDTARLGLSSWSGS